MLYRLYIDSIDSIFCAFYIPQIQIILYTYTVLIGSYTCLYPFTIHIYFIVGTVHIYYT